MNRKHMEAPRDMLAAFSKTGDPDLGYSLLAAFSSDLPIEELTPLLSSSVPGVLEGAVWIASELGAKPPELITSLVSLLRHGSEVVRADAVEAILRAGTKDYQALAVTLGLVEDQTAGVRWRVVKGLAFLPAETLARCISVSVSRRQREDLAWLVSALEAQDPVPAIRRALSGDCQSRVLYAAATATRVFSRHPEALKEIALTGTGMAKRFAQHQLELQKL